MKVMINFWNFFVGFVSTFSYVNLTFESAQLINELFFDLLRIITSIVGGVLTAILLTWLKKRGQQIKKKRGTVNYTKSDFNNRLNERT